MLYNKGILIAATNNYSFAIGTQIINILEKIENNIDIIYIVQDSFNKKDIDIIDNYIASKNIKVSYIIFDEKIFYNNIKKRTNNISNKDISWLNRYTHMAFGRFEALHLLNECKTIIYLDFDMILRKSIAELFNNKEELSVCLGGSTIGYGLGFNNNDFNQYFNIKNISTGIIVFNCKEKANKIYNEIYDLLGRYFKELENGKLVDQAIFSIVCIKNNCSIRYLDSNIYYGNISWMLSTKTASIIHAYGQNNRFWNNIKTNISWPEWEVSYRKWISLGGSCNEFDTFKKSNIIPSDNGGAVFQYLQRIELFSQIYKILTKFEKVIFTPDLSDLSKIQFNCMNINCKEKIKLIFIQNKQENVVIQLFIDNNLYISKNLKINKLNNEILSFLDENKLNISLI